MARILVIEDNAVNLELTSFLLQAHGHEVLTATDGAEKPRATAWATKSAPPFTAL